MVAVTISVIILASVYDTLIFGNTWHNKVYNQADLQEKGQNMLNQIIDGRFINSVRVGGLRQARSVTSNGTGIAYVTATDSVLYKVSYHFNGNSIYYDCQVISELDPEATAPTIGGGAPVMENITGFQIAEISVSGKRTFSLSISVEKNSNGGGANRAVLSAQVRPRNLR